MTEIVKKATLRNPAFWACLLLSMGLLVTGFFIPPKAKIDGSVLSACGILFAFSTLETVHISIKKGIDAKVKHGNTELTVGDLNNKQDSNGSEIEE
jgi:hypothetical protein